MRIIIGMEWTSLRLKDFLSCWKLLCFFVIVLHEMMFYLLF